MGIFEAVKWLSSACKVYATMLRPTVIHEKCHDMSNLWAPGVGILYTSSCSPFLPKTFINRQKKTFLETVFDQMFIIASFGER